MIKLCKECNQRPVHNGSPNALFCDICLEKRRSQHYSTYVLRHAPPVPDFIPERPPRTRMHLRWLRGQKFVNEANRIIRLDFEWQEYLDNRQRKALVSEGIPGQGMVKVG